MATPLNWALSRARGARNRTADALESGRYEIIDLPIEEAFRAMPGVMDVRNPANRIGTRLEDAGARFDQGLPMDPPMLGMTDTPGVMAYDDGRHRVLAAAERGATSIPAMVPSRDVSRIRQMLGGAAGGAAGLGALAAPEEAEAAPMGALARAMGMRTRQLWHGSPHVYDQVDLSNVGRGQGAAAYGHGFYAAEQPEVAKSYVPRDFDYEQTLLDRYQFAERAGDYDAMEAYEAAMLHQTPEEIGAQMGARGADAQEDIGQLFRQHQPSIYRVEVPDENLLDWDAPLSEQPQVVRDAIGRAGGYEAGIDDDTTGEMAYRWLQSQANYEARNPGVLASVVGDIERPDEAASRFLSESGVPGLRYLDGESRALGEGTRNYVVFDDRNVNLVDRGGEPISQMPRGREAQPEPAAGFARPEMMAATGAAGALALGPTREAAQALEQPMLPEMEAAMLSGRQRLYAPRDRIEALPEEGIFSRLGDFFLEGRPSEMNTAQRALQSLGLGQGLGDWARTTGMGDRTSLMQDALALVDVADLVAPVGAAGRRVGALALDALPDMETLARRLDMPDSGMLALPQTGGVGPIDPARLRADRLATPSEVPQALQGIRGGRAAGGFLTPEEAAKASKSDTAEGLMARRRMMPSASELATVAEAGAAKRGWYDQSAGAIDDILEDDARRFAMLLASTSPQTSVESNLLNTANIWADWVRAQRPTDPRDILQIMGGAVQGDRGVGSVLGAWRPNSFYSLGLPDEELPYAVLSGPKVDSFARNLAFPYRGNLTSPIEVTNDTWQGRLLGVPQTFFSGKPNVARTDPGKGPGYLAANSLARQAAGILSDRTGSLWTPAEVQEASWSFAKALRENALGNQMTPLDFLEQGRLTDAMIADTPDFGTLLRDPNLPYRGIFEGAGYRVGDPRPALAVESDYVARVLGQGGARANELRRAARRLANDPNP